MSGRRPHGRAIVDPTAPSAFGVCDGCGFWYNLKDLRYQMQVSGPTVINTHMRKCEKCTDELSWFMQTIVLPPDPVPVFDPRIENFAVDEVDYLTESGTDNHINTNADEPIVTDQPSQNFEEAP